jgi:hypothetical protein
MIARPKVMSQDEMDKAKQAGLQVLQYIQHELDELFHNGDLNPLKKYKMTKQFTPPLYKPVLGVEEKEGDEPPFMRQTVINCAVTTWLENWFATRVMSLLSKCL